MGELLKLKESNIEKALKLLSENLKEDSKLLVIYENEGDEGYNVSAIKFTPAELVFAFETLKLSIISGGM